jgi:conjugative transfer signal peptidase TraF
MIGKMQLNKAKAKPLVYSVLFAATFVIGCKALSYKIMFQITPSLPKGAYWVDRADRIDTGTLCVFSIPPEVYSMMKSRGWIPEHLRYYLMKPVAAKQGDVVEVSAAGLFINGRYFGPVSRYDSHGLPLPRLYRKYVLGPDEFFVATTYRNSFDSRYFGKIRRLEIRWVARPLWVAGEMLL